MNAMWELKYSNGQVVRVCQAHYSATTNKHLIDTVNKVRDLRSCDRCQVDEKDAECCVTDECKPFPVELYDRMTELVGDVDVDLDAPIEGDVEIE